MKTFFLNFQTRILFLYALITLNFQYLSFRVKFTSRAINLLRCTCERSDNVKSSFDESKAEAIKLLKFFSLTAAVMKPKSSSASVIPQKASVLASPSINIQSDDFWYPPYMIGVWNTSLKFSGAIFNKKIPFDILSSGDNLPGFSPYSIIFAPDIGKDVTLKRRYIELDSHPREDHPYNIRELVQSFLPNTTVDSAAYYFQKAPDWFHSPSNHWKISYHDENGMGEIDLLTKKRNISYFSGTVETIEFFRQTHNRKLYMGTSPPKRRVDDYALRWKLSVPGSSRNEFVSTEEIANSPSLVGTLDILAYIQPDNDLYLQTGAQPAGIFSYQVVMKRIDNTSEPGKTVYPFVWRDDGPVELDRYFGY